MSTTARGDVRSAVEFEGAGQSATSIKAIEDHLKGIATTSQTTEQRLRGMARAGEESKNALLRIGEAFTPFRRNIEVVNQIRGVMNLFVGAARSAASVIANLAERTPRTKTELDRLKTAAGQLTDEFVRGLDTGGRFSGMFTSMAGGMGGAADAARTLGAGISGLITGLGELNRIVGAAQTGGLTVLLDYLRDVAMRGTERVERNLNTNPSDRGVAQARNFVFNEYAGAESEDLPRPGQGRGDHGAGSISPGGRPPRPRRPRGSRGATENYQDTTEYMFSAMDALFRAQEQLAQQTTDKVTGVAEASLEAQLAAQVAAQDAWMGRLDVTLQQEQSNHEARMAMLEAEAEAHNSLQEKARQEDAARNQRLMQNLQGFAAAAEGISGIFDTIAAAEEERGKNADGWRKAKGVAKGILYQLEAVAAAAQGALDIGESNYGGAASAFVAAAGFEAASIMAFRDLARTGGGGGGARTTAGSYTPTTPSRINTGGGEASGEPERVTVIGLGTTDADVAAAIVRANSAMLRAGKVPLRPGSGVGYQG